MPLTIKYHQDKSPLGYPYQTLTTTPQNIRLVPILRSGLSMTDAISSLLPSAVPIHHLGLYREKTTLQPVEYYNNLPYHKTSSSASNEGEESAAGDLAIILDPIIATGSTLGAAIETLREAGARRILAIAVLASATGLAKVAEIWPEGVTVWVGGVDGETDERGMIKPGLGDVGDRLFLTVGK
jgi:uracil phosphoribosyltransferase